MEAVALFSFTASAADEIGFQKGDIVKVTDMEEDSCWVTAEVQGKRGFVPENYISLLPHPWFSPHVSRLEAEQHLRWQDTGVFLVRESESAPGEFSLSVRGMHAAYENSKVCSRNGDEPKNSRSYGDRVEHFRVLEGGGQYCIWDESFCSLNRLVDFYRTHSIAVEKVVFLRDSPSNTPSPGRNPYPNPYRSSVHAPRPLQPVLETPRLAHALCDYTPPQRAYLHFLRGDIIDLLDCSTPLTWRGRCRGRVGIFPAEYVQPL